MDRNLRQKDLLGQEGVLEKTSCIVVGTGAVGRQTALQLASMGPGKITIIDHDFIAEENLGPQGYSPSDIGKMKVDALRKSMLHLNPDLEVYTKPRKFLRPDILRSEGSAVFCCVDNMVGRRFIWKCCEGRASFFVDSRVGAEVVRIITGGDHYEKTLFSEEEALQLPCTARTTIFCSNIAAGLQVQQFSRFLRGLPLEEDFILNLLSMEVTHVCEQKG